MRVRDGATGIWHRVNGDGVPLVLLNGIAMSGASWEPVARPLWRDYQVIRCDFRGQLMSPTDQPVSLQEHAADVAHVLEGLGAAPTHVVGTSFGGAVGAMLAAEHGDCVRSLVSIASSNGFDRGMADEVVRWREACDEVVAGGDPSRLSDTLEPVVYSQAWREAHRAELNQRGRQIALLPKTWFEGLAGLLQLAEGLEIGDALGRISCPTLVIAAGEDGFIPRDRCHALAEAIPGALFEVMEGAGHAVVVERPREIVERIRRWIDGLEAATV